MTLNVITETRCQKSDLFLFIFLFFPQIRQVSPTMNGLHIYFAAGRIFNLHSAFCSKRCNLK